MQLSYVKLTSSGHSSWVQLWKWPHIKGNATM